MTKQTDKLKNKLDNQGNLPLIDNTLTVEEKDEPKPAT